MQLQIEEEEEFDLINLWLNKNLPYVFQNETRYCKSMCVWYISMASHTCKGDVSFQFLFQFLFFSCTCRDVDEFTAPLSNITTSEKELNKSHYHAPKIKFTIIYRCLESGCYSLIINRCYENHLWQSRSRSRSQLIYTVIFFVKTDIFSMWKSSSRHWK